MKNKEEILAEADDNIDIQDSGELSEEPFIRSGEVTPIHILSFAKEILLGLGVIFMVACILEFISPNNAVFEACKVTLPSLATLVIGYYFGTTKGG
ncbi:hypothetical protein [Legionella feeleii]|uniref:Uncharacterized protein n=1 Tax=Legionella feeleii TaxID=453 RepID=A0A0W0TH29_9GAMM|nr:hypothetical protein [Legionella feeleii]KTC94882.1 hypothetical protein Lfee_2546 [Legionella feeleii]SPX62034.1 Uncharacterised protein [Legionella feeleii]